MAVAIEDIKKLREQTGAGMMAAKKALDSGDWSVLRFCWEQVMVDRDRDRVRGRGSDCVRTVVARRTRATPGSEARSCGQRAWVPAESVGRLERMILLVRDSKRNRDILRSTDALQQAFPMNTRAAMAALARGQDPGADAIVVL